jgi:hypothetical protein
MSLPKQLFKSYTAISNCDLIVNLRINNTTIEEFVIELNKSIPIKSNVLAFTIYKFNRNKYLSNKQKFIDDIVGTPYYENMILWTDYNDILKYFNLTDKIFLGWDKYTNRYKAYPPKQSDTTSTSKVILKSKLTNIVEDANEDIHVNIETKHVANQDVVVIDNYEESKIDKDKLSAVDQFEQGMDDYDRLFAHMQERKKNLKKTDVIVY